MKPRIVILVFCALQCASCLSIQEKLPSGKKERFDPLSVWLKNEMNVEEQQAWVTEAKTLLAFADKDLWNIPYDDVERISSAFHRLAPSLLRPSFVSSLRWTNQVNYVVFVEASPSYESPAEATVRVTFFCTNYCEATQPQQFSAGWRTKITGFETLRSGAKKDLGDVLVIKTHWGKEYYAMTPSYAAMPALTLVRIENTAGRAIATIYGRDNLTIGPWPNVNDYPVYGEHKLPLSASAASGKTDWEMRFKQGSLAEILSSLLYLASDHTYPDRNGHPMGREYESMITQTIPHAMLEDGTIGKLLADSNPWVRDYAKMLRDRL